MRGGEVGELPHGLGGGLRLGRVHRLAVQARALRRLELLQHRVELLHQLGVVRRSGRGAFRLLVCIATLQNLMPDTGAAARDSRQRSNFVPLYIRKGTSSVYTMWKPCQSSRAANSTGARNMLQNQVSDPKFHCSVRGEHVS